LTPAFATFFLKVLKKSFKKKKLHKKRLHSQAPTPCEGALPSSESESLKARPIDSCCPDYYNIIINILPGYYVIIMKIVFGLLYLYLYVPTLAAKLQKNLFVIDSINYIKGFH
jgi:hypothetical protein